MKTRAVRLYGESDLRLEEFDMGELKDDEILMELITDSVCMSTYKESIQGAKHQRVNDDISEHPIIVGHEFAGIIREVGAKWKDKYQVGTKYTMQPAINIKGSMAAIGYSYEYCGGAATFIKVPPIVMEKDCLLPFDENSAFFEASLAEPMSCIIGAFHSMYHSERGVYEHKMGIVEGGKSALLASCGPMGLGAISYMLNCDRKPSLLVITDIDEVRLKRASELFTEEYAKEMSNIIITNMYEINIKDHGKEIIDKLSKHFTEEEIKKNYPKRIKNYVAIEESEVVGTISINNLRGDTTGTKYIILTLFVKMEKHHQGIGTMLIKKIENYARSVGAKELYIPASIYACEFYRKLGYDYLDGIKEQNEDKEYTLVKYL